MGVEELMTPALDLQGAPPLTNGLGTHTAQASPSGSEGFGAAFTSSLAASSSSASTAVAEDGSSATTAAKQAASSKPDPSSDLVRTSPDANKLAEHTPGSVKSTANRAVGLLASGATRSSVNTLSNMLRKTLDAVSSERASSSVVSPTSPTDSEIAKAIQLPRVLVDKAGKSTVEDLSVSNKQNGDSAAGVSLAVDTLHALALPGASVGKAAATAPPDSDAPRTASVGKAGDGKSYNEAVKGKTLGHDLSQPVTANGTSVAVENLLAALTPSTSLVPPVAHASASQPADSASTVTSKISLPQPSAVPKQAAPTEAVNSVTAGARLETSRSTLVAAWNSIEPGLTTTQSSNGPSPIGQVTERVNQSASVTVRLPVTNSIETSLRTLAAGPAAEATSGRSLPAAAPAETGSTGRTTLSDSLSTAPPLGQAITLPAQSSSISTDVLPAAAPSAVKSTPTTVTLNPIAFRAAESSGQVQGLRPGSAAASSHPAEGAPASELRHAIGQVSDQSAPVASSGEPLEPSSTRNALPIAVAAANETAAPSRPGDRSDHAATVTGTALASAQHKAAQTSADPDHGPERSQDRAAESDATASTSAVHADTSTTPGASSPNHAVLPASSEVAALPLATVGAVPAVAAHHELGTLSTSASQPASGGLLTSATQITGTDAVHGAGGVNASSSQPHQTIAATPNSLEVGVHSGTQGWLKIRAEVGDQGGVTASLAAASPGGEQMLKGQLPALNAYLHSEQLSVTTSVAERTGLAHGVVAHDPSSGLNSTAGGTAAQDTSLLQGGAGRGTNGQSGGHLSDSLSSRTSPTNRPDERYPDYASRADTAGTGPASTTLDGSGRWLNVRV